MGRNIIIQEINILIKTHVKKYCIFDYLELSDPNFFQYGFQFGSIIILTGAKDGLANIAFIPPKSKER